MWSNRSAQQNTNGIEAVANRAIKVVAERVFVNEGPTKCKEPALAVFVRIAAALSKKRTPEPESAFGGSAGRNGLSWLSCTPDISIF